MYMYTYIYIVKSCHQHSYGFQNSMSSWGVGVCFSKLQFSHDFFKIMPKVRCFKNTNDNGPFFQNLISSWGVYFNYCGRSFDQASTLSLRGPAQFTLEARSTGFTGGWDGMGWMGLVGWDGVSKVSFNFLYTMWVYRSCICILIYILKSCHQHSYGFQNLMSRWGVGGKLFKITIFQMIFLKSC